MINEAVATNAGSATRLSGPTVKGSGKRTGGRSNSRDRLKMITEAVADPRAIGPTPEAPHGERFGEAYGRA
jgi:hypothetical protein